MVIFHLLLTMESAVKVTSRCRFINKMDLRDHKQSSFAHKLEILPWHVKHLYLILHGNDVHIHSIPPR